MLIGDGKMKPLTVNKSTNECQPYQTVAKPVWWVEGENLYLGAKGCPTLLHIDLSEEELHMMRAALLDMFDFKKGRP